MPDTSKLYKNILVAVDFSPSSAATLKQALWLAKEGRSRIVIAHSIPDMRRIIATTPRIIGGMPQLALPYGDIDHTQRELYREAEGKLSKMIAALHAADIDISYSILLGDAYVTITLIVQKECYDLVVAGTRGAGAWEKFLIGSTAKRLIRKCPSAVLIVKEEHLQRPIFVLA